MTSTIRARPESIELISGHPALDLVNTVSWRNDPERSTENLAEPHDLLAWAPRVTLLDEHRLAAIGIAMAQDGETAQRALGRIHELREALYEHLAGCIDHPDEPPQIRPGSALHRAFSGAVTVSSLAGTPARWELQADDPLDLARILALQTLDLLQTKPLGLLRRCDGDGCGWLFLDTTRNHSRRWCSSRDCGNRDRARRHYARKNR